MVRTPVCRMLSAIYKGETLVDKYVTDENGQFTTKEYVCDVIHVHSSNQKRHTPIGAYTM